MNNLLFLWQIANAEPTAGTNPLFWPFLLVGLAIFYFFMIRPQVKEQKAQQEFFGKLKKGSKVVTGSGIHGTIVDMEETHLSLLIAPKTIITIQRSAISLELTKAVYTKSVSSSKDNITTIEPEKV